jgi:hypothetical protein
MTDMQKHIPGCKLDADIAVACEIYHYQIIKHPVNWSTLDKSLEWVLDKRVISHSMMTLMDWGIVRRYTGNLGELMPGRAGFLWEIAEDHIHRMKPLYEEHWKNFRQVYTLNGKTY